MNEELIRELKDRIIDLEAEVRILSHRVDTLQTEICGRSVSLREIIMGGSNAPQPTGVIRCKNP